MFWFPICWFMGEKDVIYLVCLSTGLDGKEQIMVVFKIIFKFSDKLSLKMGV